MRLTNLLIICLPVFVTSDQTIEVPNNDHQNDTTSDTEIVTECEIESIQLYLHIRGSEKSFKIAPVRSACDLCGAIDFGCPTVMYIHGLNGNATGRDVVFVTSEYISRGDHNVIIVDWGVIARKVYPLAAAGTKEVGIAVAKALDVLVGCGLRPESLHIVGHSLGSHVAGSIARNSNNRSCRIIGLDPAGPLFNVVMEPLSRKDAGTVINIHTDVGFYGIKLGTGTVDFYPNGGHRHAPGCPKIYAPYSDEDFCSHRRSYEYYAESVRNENAFYAIACHSYVNFVAGLCKKNRYTIMGYATPSNVTGKFYLETNDACPYGRGESGMKRTS